MAKPIRTPGTIPADAPIRHDGELLSPGSFSLPVLDSAWAAYVDAAVRIQPRVLESLLTNSAIDAIGDDRAATERHIEAWCRKWGFSLFSVHVQANNTLAHAKRMRARGDALPHGFVCDRWGNSYPEYSIDDPFADCTVRVGPAQYFDAEGNLIPPRNPDGIPHPFPELAGRLVAGFDVARLRRTFPGLPPHDELGHEGTEVRLDLPRLYWEPTGETRAEAHNRITAMFAERLKDELATIESAYRAHGYRSVPEIRNLDHFEWLARFQLLEETYDEIALVAGVDESTVKKGVRSARRILNLPRRPRRVPHGGNRTTCS